MKMQPAVILKLDDQDNQDVAEDRIKKCTSFILQSTPRYVQIYVLYKVKYAEYIW